VQESLHDIKIQTIVSTHYGGDLTDSKKSILTVWGSGKGKITHCGFHPTGEMLL
jgi:hypothetical protein